MQISHAPKICHDCKHISVEPGEFGSILSVHCKLGLFFPKKDSCKRKSLVMAAVDKIYGTARQRQELLEWLLQNAPVLTKSLGPIPSEGEYGAIAQFSIPDDIFLYEHCDIEWVREAIKEQYSGPPELPENYWFHMPPDLT